MLAMPTIRARLIARASQARRVVLLGDVFELLDVELREALSVSRPLLVALGAAVGAHGEIVLVGGNHDHALYEGFIAAHPGFGLSESIEPARDPGFAAIAELVAPARLTVAYPGAWLRDDVYATHGHYLDRHITLPPPLRAALPGAVREMLASGERAGADATPADYERALAPAYAAFRVARDFSLPEWIGVLVGNARDSDRLSGVAGPIAAALPAAAIEAFGTDALGLQLRRAGLRAMARVIGRLQIDAAHVVFGHTHRTGPLPDDPFDEWVAPAGAAMHNCGSWVYEPLLLAGDGSANAYWPGGCVIVDDDGRPRLERLLGDVAASELRR